MQQDKYYYLMDVKTKQFISIITEEQLYDLESGQMSYQLTDEQVDEMVKIAKKKIATMGLLDKLKTLFGKAK